MATKPVSSIKNKVLSKKTVKAESVIASKAKQSQSAKVEAEVNVKAPAKTTRGGLSVPVFTLAGKESGSLDLPKTIFGAEVNQALLKQALRVYLNNAKGHFSNTKTRGEVTGSTRKIYKQKGTGRARHGGITAPIFVGGGIALGPKARKVTLDLPKKMKKAALISALSQKLTDKQIFALSGLDKATGKTSEIARLVSSIKNNVSSKSANAVIVGDKALESASRAVRNIKGVEFMTVDQLNALEVIKTQSLVLTKEAVNALEARIMKGETGK